MRSRSIISLLLSFSLALPLTAWADSIVRVTEPHSRKDQRHLYNHAVLNAALEKTIDSHGTYRVEFNLPATQRKRALVEMISGDKINVHIVATQPEWEEKTIAIRIPIVKGLLGYRLFLIKRQTLARFENLESIDQLKALQAGLRQQWTTTEAMQMLGFNIVTGIDYEGLFNMLDLGRFDYFPRGVNEIYGELENRQANFPDMMIEPRTALYIPQPTYIFVSPQHPQLAQRIEAGLQAMLDDGSLDRLFWQYHGESIEHANLAGRRIFTTENPLLHTQTPIDQTDEWIKGAKPN